MSDNELIENIKLAFELQKRGQYREAIATFYKVLAIEPDNVEVLVQIAYLFYARHDLDTAIQYYEKALQFDHKNSVALEGLLNIYQFSNDYKKALCISNKISEISPNLQNFVQHLYLLCLNENYEIVLKYYEVSEYRQTRNPNLDFYVGLSYYKLKDLASAEIYLKNAIEGEQINYEACYYLAKILFNNKEYANADNFLTKMLDNSQSAKAYNLKGLIRLNLNNNTKAVNFFLAATKIDTKNPEYMYNLAIAYSLSGWNEEAEISYKNALALAPDNLHYHYTLAYFYYETKQFNLAKIEIEFVLNHDENYIDAKILQALIMTEENELLQAKNLLEKLLAKGVKSDFLYFSLGKTYKYLALYDKAIAQFSAALAIKENSLNYMCEQAECLLLNQNSDEAYALLDKIIELNKYYIYAYILKTQILMETLNYDKALEIIEIAITLDNSNSKAYFLKALILQKTGLTKIAIRTMKTAITLAPQEIDYYKTLASFYNELGESKDAYLYYKEILNIEAGNPNLYLEVAKCAEQLYYYDEAKNYYLCAYALAPADINIILNYVNLLLTYEKYKNALKFLSHVISTIDDENNIKLLKSKYQEIKLIYLKKASIFEKIMIKFLKL